MFPLIKGFRSTNYFKAFMLNAVVTALIAVVAIETRVTLQDRKGDFYEFFNNYLVGKDLSEIQITLITFLATFVASILVYNFMFLLFHYGGGFMITNSNADRNYF